MFDVDAEIKCLTVFTELELELGSLPSKIPFRDIQYCITLQWLQWWAPPENTK